MYFHAGGMPDGMPVLRLYCGRVGEKFKGL